MGSTVQTLTKDVWTLVLQNVTDKGQVFILDQEKEPTVYLVAFVLTGDPAPDLNFDGGVKFFRDFVPAVTEASDFYIMPKKNDGKVVVFT